MKKILFWLGVFMVSLLVMVQPAQASGTVYKAQQFDNHASGNSAYYGTWSTSADMLAQAHAVYPSGTWSLCNTLGVCNNSSLVFYYTMISGTGSCPANSTGSTTCTCTNPYIPSGNAMSCINPIYQGSTALSACNSSGCNGTAYSTAAAACESFITGPSPSSATMTSATTCKIDQYFSDGSHKVSYKNIQVANSCDSADSACLAALATSTATNAAAVQASNVAATSTLAASAAAAAYTVAAAAAQAAGASSSVAASMAQQAAANTAANLSAGVGAPNPDPLPDVCLLHPERIGCSSLGTAPAADTVPTANATFSTSAISFATSSGCPAPINFSVNLPMIGAKSYAISWQPACDLATTLQPLFLALGAITAAFVFAAGLSI